MSVGLVEEECKSRFNNHNLSFKHKTFQLDNTFKLYVAREECFK